MIFNRVRSHNEFKILVIISVIIDLLLLRKTFHLEIVQAADWPIPMLSMEQIRFIFLGAWNYQASAPSGSNLFLVFSGLISALTSHPALVQKLFYLIPWSLIPFTMYLFLGRVGVTRRIAVPFSLLYQFGPWINGMLMDGEPVFVAIYLFLPLFLYVFTKYKNNPVSLYIASSIVLFVPTAYTLQSIVFVFYVAPFILLELAKGKIKIAVMDSFAFIGAFTTVIIASLYSTGAYSAAFSSLSGGSISSFLNFPPAINARFWLIIFFVLILLMSIFLFKTKNSKRVLFALWTAISGFLLLIYPGLGIFPLGRLLLTRFFLFAPFVNYDKFILYLWFELLVISAIFISQLHISQAQFKKGHIYQRIRKYLYGNNRKVQVTLAACAISVLLFSSATLEIQSYGSHDTGLYLFSEGSHFNKNEIQPQYLSVVDYLVDHNVSYGLSAHTVLFPENPGNTLPFYVGQQIIPGYIGEFQNGLAHAIINGINGNNSGFLMLSALYGIEYFVVMKIPSTSWSGSNGTPSLSMWGSNNIFVGNWTYYLNDLEHLSGLNLLYEKSGLYIFKNEYYLGPVTVGNNEAIKALSAGNYLYFTNKTPLSGNILSNAIYSHSGVNFTVNSDLNLTLYKNSSIAQVYNFTRLKPDSTYLFSFNFTTTENLSTFYGNGQNGGMVFYNVSPDKTNITGGTVITIRPAYEANGSYSAIFRTSKSDGHIDAKVNFQLQPPRYKNEINSSLSNVSLIQINGTNTFYNTFHPVHIRAEGYSQFSIVCNCSNSKSSVGSQIIIDQFYQSGWKYNSGGNSGIVSESNLGLLAFNLSNSSHYELQYVPQYSYNLKLLISYGGLSYLLFLAIVYFVYVRRVKPKW